jgi:hypothetical protein
MAIVKGGSSAPIPVSSAQVYGVGTTTSIQVRDVGSKIFYLDPSAAPFTLLTERSGNKTASNPKFEWYEKALRPKTTTLYAGSKVADDTTTTTAGIVATDSNVIQVRDIVLIPSTGELVLVTAQSDASTYNVVRNLQADGSGFTATDGDDVFVVGSANYEGADVGVPDEWQESHLYNYTQIFRRPFGATRTREASETYFGQTRPKLRAEKAIEHAIDIERAFMFGTRYTSTSTNTIQRTTGGFTYWATSNPLDLSGASLSEPDLEGWMEDLFQHGASGDSRVLFCSPLVITAIDQLAAERIRLVPSDQTYGIAVRQYMTSHGTLNIVKHRLLENGTAGQGYGDWAFCVDPKKLTMRTLSGGSTKLLMDRQGPGVDGWVDEYLTEVGLQFVNPEVHGILKNVGAAA